MFIKRYILDSSDCIELQYIKKGEISNKNLLKVKNIEHFKEDSLFVKSSDLAKFEDIYGDAFDSTMTPDGSNKFYAFGINLYDISRVKEIYSIISKLDGDKLLLDWLEIAVKNNYRIYILGF